MMDDASREQIVNEIVKMIREAGKSPSADSEHTESQKSNYGSDSSRESNSSNHGSDSRWHGMTDRSVEPPWSAEKKQEASVSETGSTEDTRSEFERRGVYVQSPKDPDALRRMLGRTTARIGVGKCGPRLHTQTMLKLRADHAAARDSVFQDVDQSVLDRLGLFSVQTKCRDKNEYLTRPDLGRQLSDDAAETIRKKCIMHPDVQIFVSDGLSSTAVDANAADILPILLDGLHERGLKTGTPFYVRFGRVGVEDAVSEVLDAEVICVLLGERPGLATAESMSAYICYRASVGMMESRRTVVSNIHRNGISPVEAGAYICDVIEQILKQKASGVELRKG